MTSQELTAGISSHISDVEEFAFIVETAKKLGIRHTWLFGGTAAGFAHYNKWDLQRQHGDSRFRADRFDYDFTSIYRSTQDADIVIDGTSKQAGELERALSEGFKHLEGKKSVWEVRLLRERRGDKVALLDNRDFLNQSTDSNSTGMIELTPPLPGESRVRDLMDWNNQKDSVFLKDVLAGRLTYYDSALHNLTSRSISGLNPRIISVIRYLTKAFQFGLTISKEDEDKIRPIIEKLDERQAKSWGSYVAKWLGRNVPKLFSNAVDLEYAANVLDRLGLRKKLIALSPYMNDGESLKHLLERKPLQSFEVGQGSGKTAAQLGLDIVSHAMEFGGLDAYESISAGYSGGPNVFEAMDAQHRAGFYTAVGTEGGGDRGGKVILFKIKPEAREGKDFKFLRRTLYVLMLNKNAFEIVPGSLNIGFMDYMRSLNSLPDKDSSLFRLERRALKDKRKLSGQEEAELLKLIHSSTRGYMGKVLQIWFDRPESNDHPEIVDEIARKSSTDTRPLDFFLEIWSKASKFQNPKILYQFLDSGVTQLPKTQWLYDLKFPNEKIRSDFERVYFKNFFTENRSGRKTSESQAKINADNLALWKRNNSITTETEPTEINLQRLLRGMASGFYTQQEAKSILSSSPWKNTFSSSDVFRVLNTPEFKDYLLYIEGYGKTVDINFAKFYFSFPESANDEKVIRDVINSNDGGVMVRYLNTLPALRSKILSPKFDLLLILPTRRQDILSDPHWDPNDRYYIERAENVLKNGKLDFSIPDIYMQKLFRDPTKAKAIVDLILSKKENAKFLNLEKKPSDYDLINVVAILRWSEDSTINLDARMIKKMNQWIGVGDNEITGQIIKSILNPENMSNPEIQPILLKALKKISYITPKSEGSELRSSQLLFDAFMKPGVAEHPFATKIGQQLTESWTHSQARNFTDFLQRLSKEPEWSSHIQELPKRDSFFKCVLRRFTGR